MPEIPDLTVYAERLTEIFGGQRLDGLRVTAPHLLKTVEPPPEEFVGRRLLGAARRGKQLLLAFEGDTYCLLHLMRAGRLKMRKVGASQSRKTMVAAFDFEEQTLLFTEQGTKKRTRMSLIASRLQIDEWLPPGIEPLAASSTQWAQALRSRNRTLKRALTDQRLVRGIGNTFSDEILHRAGLSPFTRTATLSDESLAALHRSTLEVLNEWTDRLRLEVGSGFPEKVSAFREGMAVHGRFKEPCPVCGSPVQRVVLSDSEFNYCPGCQTDGKIYADRSLSKLLRNDFPRSLDELEERALLSEED